MLAFIRAIHAELKGADGSPRRVRELRTRGFSASKARVERRRRENGIHARHKRRMTADLVTDALTMAGFRKRPAPGLVHHSDRGSQDASHAFQAKRVEYGMHCSRSRKGNCWDHAPTESWFNRFKNERGFGERFETRADMTALAFEYIVEDERRPEREARRKPASAACGPSARP